MSFVNKLTNIKKATKQQKQTQLWDIEGILHNQKFKFDTRPIQNNTKIGSFKTKADKMVFDMKDEYIIVDVEELHQNLKENNVREVHLQDLISKLEWNIILPK